MSDDRSPFRPVTGGVRIRVRLTPKASRDGIEGVQADADGLLWVKAAVTAVPEDGKANAALLKLLAKAWHLPKTSLAVVAGATDRRKTVLASGEPDTLMTQFTAWLGGCND